MSSDQDDVYQPTENEVTWLYGPDPEPDSWLPRNLAELEDRPPVEPTLGGLGLVYPGKRHVFSGPQESAKTLAAYVVGLHVVREGQRVILIDFEMGPWDAKTRLRELGATDDELASFAYVEPSTPSSPERIGALVGMEPGLVLVDAAAGAYAVEGFDDNARKDAEEWANKWVAPFWRQGVATLVIDHVVKNAESRGNYAIGSGRKIEGVDVHLGFTVISPIKRGTSGRYQITTHKDRGGYLKRGKLATFELASDPAGSLTWRFVATPETDEEHPFRPTVKMEQASRWLEKQLEERVPMSHIETGVGGNRDALRLAIQVLVDEGYFREEAGPRNARLMTLSRPYREEFDDLSPTSPDLSQNGGRDDLSSSPPPYKGGEVGGLVDGMGEVSSPDDGIPF